MNEKKLIEMIRGAYNDQPKINEFNVTKFFEEFIADFNYDNEPTFTDMALLLATIANFISYEEYRDKVIEMDRLVRGVIEGDENHDQEVTMVEVREGENLAEAIAELVEGVTGKVPPDGKLH